MKVYVVTYTVYDKGRVIFNEVLGAFVQLHDAQKEIEKQYQKVVEYHGTDHKYEKKEPNIFEFSSFDYKRIICESNEIELITDDFPVTTVCRDDLESIGFDTTNVDDNTMQ